MATTDFLDDFMISDDQDISPEGLSPSPSLLNHKQHTNFFLQDIDSHDQFLPSLKQRDLDMAHGVTSESSMPSNLAFPMEPNDVMEDGASRSYVALQLILVCAVN